MSTIRKDPQRPSDDEAASAEAGAGPIDKSTVMKSFYQRALDERDDEIERLKQDNQRLRAKIIAGTTEADDGASDLAAGAAESSGRSGPGANAEQLSELLAERDKLAAEASDSKDRMLRALAELDNVRRRTEREKLDISKYAISEFARDVIGLADDIQRAIDHVPAEAAANDAALKSFLEGVQLMERQLLATLERHGVVRLAPMGERFDPNLHQAVMEQENPDVPPGTIVQVLQAGFMIGDRILRPAVVVVARGGAKVPKPSLKPEDQVPAAEAAPGTAPEPKPEALMDRPQNGSTGSDDTAAS